ncbi:MAG: hypothetical protein ACP6IU_00105 [Candidatus Asgardarchaeia archaeon]
MEDIVVKAFLNATNIKRVEKKVVKNTINQINERIGLKALNVLINKWKDGKITLFQLLEILDISIDKLRLVIRELKYMPEHIFEKLIERDINSIEQPIRYHT